MKFWDASAIVPLPLGEDRSIELRSLASDDPELVSWWATPLECVSAIARRERMGVLTADDAGAAITTLDGLAAAWLEVPPSDPLRQVARRIVRVHDLRAADALQLAAARVASDERAETLPLVTVDEWLALAAGREGFPVLP